MTTVYFGPDLGGIRAVKFNYNAEIVTLLKSQVPRLMRDWDPERKQWYVDVLIAPSLAATMRGAGHTVVGIDSEPITTRRPDDTNWARALFRRVGPTRRTAVYRALSRCLHPDTAGGDKQLQQELNDAHTDAIESAGR